MHRSFYDDVYDSLQGELVVPIAGVTDCFAPGMPCEQWYQEMLDAYARLRSRLGVLEEDQDVEIIIGSLLNIQRELCRKMYQYGAEFSSGINKSKPTPHSSATKSPL